MTVAALNKDTISGEFKGYYCEWFKGASKERAGFGEESLQTYVVPKKA